ncbi:MAG: glycosyltransferase family 2 protein [Acetobacteraceae bacterium]
MTGRVCLGIGIATYNRRLVVAETIERVRHFTRHEPAHLVVADDGSQDGTAEMLLRHGIPLVTGPNRGIAWNKNRALFLLAESLCCDVVILLEDDTRPVVPGWETEWIEAARQWGHVNYAGPWLRSDFLSGSGSAIDPFLAPVLTAQCSAFARAALAFAGYFDTRFRGYGHEHVEHSRRLVRAGYGGCERTDDDGEQVLFRLITGGVASVNVASHANQADIERNLKIARRAMADRHYRAPWRTERQMIAFRTEQQEAMARLPQFFQLSAPTAPGSRDRHEFVQRMSAYLNRNRLHA